MSHNRATYKPKKEIADLFRTFELLGRRSAFIGGASGKTLVITYAKTLAKLVKWHKDVDQAISLLSPANITVVCCFLEKVLHESMNQQKQSPKIKILLEMHEKFTAANKKLAENDKPVPPAPVVPETAPTTRDNEEPFTLTRSYGTFFHTTTTVATTVSDLAPQQDHALRCG